MSTDSPTTSAALAPVAPLRAADVAWDIETDVLVAGYGCAGASAAIEARAQGVEVLILERTGGWGGASAMSGGLIYLGGGTPLQKACGYEDTADEMFAFLMAATGPGADEAKVRVYCDESVDHYDWLTRCDVPFNAKFYDGAFPEPLGDEGLMFSGGENSAPWRDIAVPAPRAHVPAMADKQPGERSSGWRLMKGLADTAEGNGAVARYDTWIDRLVVSDDGRIAGVIARQYDETVAIRARRGVVLTAGGFIQNDEMLALHSPRLLHPGVMKLGTDNDDGRAIRMAQALGAAVKNMDAGEVAFAGALAPRAVLVNVQGQRFINEDSYFGRIGQHVLFRQEGRSILVIDEELSEELAQNPLVPPPTWVVETLAELETEAELPAGSLEATIGLYNRHAEAGEDPLYGKAPEMLKPLRAPFGAVDLRAGGFACFTLGGLHTTVAGEVLDIAGAPIPGLFAAGRTTSGIPAWGYCSGTSLGDGTFFGRRAGRSAATPT